MKILGIMRLRTSVSAAVMRAALGMSVVAGTGVLMSAPAYAQAALTTDQLSAIQTSLKAAIQAANGDSAATEAAISQVIQNAIGSDGSATAGAVTSAVIADLEGFNVAQDVIGNGLAMAAAAESPTNVVVATAIASTVRDEGRLGEKTAFTSKTGSLGYTNLASIANSNPNPTGQTAAGGLTSGGLGNSFSGGFSGGGGGGGGGGGCLNPSCTSL